MKLLFIDTEFTGEHAHTTLVSIAMVTPDGDSLTIALNDYDKDQVTDWLQENVLAHTPTEDTISSEEAFERVADWLEEYSQGEKVCLISFGLGPDQILLYELWRYDCPGRKYFHSLHCLPDYLNHSHHIDLRTLFAVVGLDPDINREEFINNKVEGRKHDPLFDANVVKECFFKLLQHPELHSLTQKYGL